MNKLSIIVPAYNEEETLEIFVNTVNKETVNLPLDKTYYFVNDGSIDNTLAVIKTLSNKYSNVKYISFSKNFGKEAALLAGLKIAEGDFITVMDADLQDPPEMLNEMYDNILKGYDVVGTRRISRNGEPPIRSFFAKNFYRIINKISETKIVDGVRDFRLMTRQVCDSILELEEYNRFSKGIFSWVGFDTIYLPYINRERVAGRTSWNFWGLLKYSIDGIVNFSELPLNFATLVGLLSFLSSILLSCFYFFRTLFFGNDVAGFPSIVILILLIGGLQLFSLGIIGKYISKIFLETKKRPNYIIKESSIKR